MEDFLKKCLKNFLKGGLFLKYNHTSGSLPNKPKPCCFFIDFIFRLMEICPLIGKSNLIFFIAQEASPSRSSKDNIYRTFKH